MVHLLCIGISLKLTEITSPNIRIVCNKCVNKKSEATSDLNASFSTKSIPKTVTNKAILQELSLLKSAIKINGKKLDSIEKKTDNIVSYTETLAVKSSKKSKIPPKNHPSNSTQKTSKPAKQSYLPKQHTPLKFGEKNRRQKWARNNRLDFLS